MKPRQGDFWLGYPRFRGPNLPKQQPNPTGGPSKRTADHIFIFIFIENGAMGRGATLCRAWSLKERFPFAELEQRDLTDLFPPFWVVTEGGQYG